MPPICGTTDDAGADASVDDAATPTPDAGTEDAATAADAASI
jgi:hypothetical protein